MGRNSFGMGECIGIFILGIYLMFLLVKGLAWLISTIYKEFSKSPYQEHSTRTKKHNHSKKKRTYHKKTHSYKTQRNDQYNHSKKKEHYQRSDLRAKVAKAFHVLNLKGNESEGEIKKAYRKAVKEWHPDNNHNWYAEKKFIEIHDAYTLLLSFKKTGAI